MNKDQGGGGGPISGGFGQHAPQMLLHVLRTCSLRTSQTTCAGRSPCRAALCRVPCRGRREPRWVCVRAFGPAAADRGVHGQLMPKLVCMQQRVCWEHDCQLCSVPLPLPAAPPAAATPSPAAAGTLHKRPAVLDFAQLGEQGVADHAPHVPGGGARGGEAGKAGKDSPGWQKQPRPLSRYQAVWGEQGREHAGRPARLRPQTDANVALSGLSRGGTDSQFTTS